MDKVFLLAVLLIMGVFGYRAYSLKQTAIEASLSIQQKAEASEGHGALSEMGKEQQKRMAEVRDSMDALVRENNQLRESMNKQRAENERLKQDLEMAKNEDEKWTEVYERLKIIEGALEIAKEDIVEREARIATLEAQLIQRDLVIDSLNQVIVEKNDQLAELSYRVKVLEAYATKINDHLPQTVKIMGEITEELKAIHASLDDSNMFNRKKRVKAAGASIQTVAAMYKQLNDLYENAYFDNAIAELQGLEQQLIGV